MSDSVGKESKRGEILKAAEKLFGHFGLKKTSLEDIAESIGLAKTSIYYYFKSKAELFIAVINNESRVLLTRMKDEINKHENPKDKLEAYFETRMKYLEELVNLKRVTKKAAKELFPRAEKLRASFFEAEKKIVATILRQGVKEDIFKIDDPEFVAVAIIASMKGLESSLVLYLDREIRKDDYSAMLQILFNGILKEQK